MRFKLLTALTITLLLIGCGGAAARKSSYIEKGRAYFNAHNYVKAQLEFRNALQLDPSDAEASYLAGAAAERLGNWREAAQMYEAAIASNSKHLEARAQLGLLLAYGGAPDKAITVVEPGLALAPHDPDLLTARAAARARLGDQANARGDVEEAVRGAPDNENAVALLASIYQQAGEMQQAIDLVSRAVQSPAATPQLRMVLAQIYLASNRHADAVRVLQRLVAVEPDSLAYRYQLAELLLLDKNVDEAETTLRAAVAHWPQSTELELALANMLAANRSYDVAEPELRHMSAASPSNYALRLLLGQLYVDHQRLPEAVAVYRMIIQNAGRSPSSIAARNRLVSIYLKTNQTGAAARLIDDVLKQSPRDNDALFARAELSLSRDEADAAIVDLRAVQRDQPNSIPVQRAIARAYRQNGDSALAEETLQAAIERSPNNADLQLDLASLLASGDQVDRALQILERLASSQPANLTLLRALFDLQLAHNDIAGARRTALSVQKAHPELAIGNYLSGLAELADGKTDAARAAFDRALTIEPDAAEPITRLVRLDLAQQQSDQAITLIDQSIGLRPSNPFLRNLKGEVLTDLKRTDPAIAAFRQAIALDPTWIKPYQDLAAAELTAGRNEDGIKALQEGIKATHDAPLLRTSLADLYQRLGRGDQAIAEYEANLKRDPDSPVAAKNLAIVLVTDRSDKTSLDRARSLSERFAGSRNATYLGTYGWVLYRCGEYGVATSALQKAVDRAPQIPELHYHLAMAQLSSGARDAARSNLEQALQSKIPFAENDEAKKTLATLQR